MRHDTNETRVQLSWNTYQIYRKRIPFNLNAFYVFEIESHNGVNEVVNEMRSNFRFASAQIPNQKDISVTLAHVLEESDQVAAM